MVGVLGEAMNLVFSIVAKDETRAGLGTATAGLRTVKGAADEAGSAADLMSGKFGRAATAIAASATAVAGGITLVTARAKEVNSQLDAIALSTGNSSEEMRALARSLQDVSFSYDEVVQTFQTAESYGVRGGAAFKQIASDADTLADAIHASAPESAATLLQIGEAFELNAGKAGELKDAIAVAVRSGQTDLGELARLTGRSGEAFDDLNLSAVDMVATWVALKREGAGSRTALRDIAQAATSAAAAQQTWTDSMDEAIATQADLTERIADTSDQLGDMGRQIAASERSIADYTEQIAEQEQTVADLAAAYEASTTNTDEFAAAYAQVTAQADSLTASLASEEQQLASLAGQLAEARQAHADLTDQYASTAQEISRLEAEYATAVTANDYFAEALERATSDLERAEAAYSSNADRIADYREQLVDLDAAYQDLVEDQADAATAIERLRVEQARQLTTVTTLEEEYRQLAASTEIVDEAEKKHVAELESLENQYDRVSGSLDDYTEKLEKNARQRQEILRDLDDENETLAELQAEYDMLTSAQNAQGGQLYVDPATMDALREKIEASKERVDDLTYSAGENADQQKDLTADLAAARAEQARLAQELASTRANTDWYTEAVTKQAEALAALGDRLGDARERYADYNDRIDDARQRFEEFAGKLADNREAVQQTNRDLATAAGTSNDLATAVARARRDVAEFGDAAYTAAAGLSPYQEALAKTQDRAQRVQDELGNARDRLADLGQQIADNEGSQAKLVSDMETGRQKIADYRTELEKVQSELQKFRDAHKDIVKDVSPFEEAQARTTQKIQDAATAYKDGVDRLGDLRQARADEVTNLSEYREDYEKLNTKLRDHRDALDEVIGKIRTLNANPPGAPKDEFYQSLGLTPEQIAGIRQELEQPGAAERFAGEENKRYTTADQAKSWLDKLIVDLGTTLEPLEPLASLATMGFSAATSFGLLKLLTGGGLGAAATAGGATQTTLAAFGMGETAAAAAGGAGASVIGGGIAATGIGSYLGSQLGPLGSLAAFGPVAGPAVGISGTVTKPFWDLVERALTGQDLEFGFGTTFKTPTGDVDIIKLLTGGMVETGRAGEVIPWTATIDPTITGGMEITRATNAEIDDGLARVPGESEKAYLTRVAGTADDQGSVFGSANSLIVNGIARIPGETDKQYLTRIAASADDRGTVYGSASSLISTQSTRLPGESERDYLTRIAGQADDDGTIYRSADDLLTMQTRRIPGESDRDYLTRIAATADDDGSIFDTADTVIFNGLARIPGESDRDYLTRIAGTANDNGTIGTSGNSAVTEGLKVIPKESTLDFRTTINGMVTNAGDWWSGIMTSLSSGWQSLSQWVSEHNPFVASAGGVTPLSAGGAAGTTPVVNPQQYAAAAGPGVPAGSYIDPTTGRTIVPADPTYDPTFAAQVASGSAGTATGYGGVGNTPADNYTPAARPTGPANPDAGARPGDPGVSYGGTVAADTTPAPMIQVILSPTSGGAPLTVTCMAETMNATAVQWRFGDGAMGTGARTSHTFYKAGSYEVVGTAIGPTGKQALASATVTVTGGSSGRAGTVPRFHDGGTFEAPPGETEGIAVLKAGEKVQTAEQASLGSTGEIVTLLREIKALLSQGQAVDVNVKADWGTVVDRVVRAGTDANNRGGVRRSS